MDKDDIPRELEQLRALRESYVSGKITHLDEDETGQLRRDSTSERIASLDERIAYLDKRLSENRDA